MIEKETFWTCKNLWSITFADDAELEEIREAAFQGSGLESFTAPPSLKKIGFKAFANCSSLKDFRLNENIQELGWFCLWKTGVRIETLPKMWTPERVGLQEDPRVLRLPDGLEEVGDNWLRECDIETLIVPSSVRKFGVHAFAYCEHLREVVFQFDY